MPKKPSPLKEEAQKLYRKGLSTKEISEKLKKPLRSVQRWIQEINGQTGNQRSPKESSAGSNLPFKHRLPTSLEAISFPNVVDLRAREYLTDIRFFESPEFIDFDLNLTKWETFSYNRTIYCQAFEQLSQELAKDENEMSLSRAKILSSLMSKHLELVDRAASKFDANWAVSCLVKLGYAVIEERELKALASQREFDSYHIFRSED